MKIKHNPNRYFVPMKNNFWHGKSKYVICKSTVNLDYEPVWSLDKMIQSVENGGYYEVSDSEAALL